MIEVRGLTKRFGETLAVDQLSFQVQPGIVTGFLGPNGSGKSTTMRMIMGLDNPTAGAATVNGKDYRELSAPMHEVGALLDAKAVHGGMTAEQHLRWVARAGKVSPGRVPAVLELVGLEKVADRRTGGFSLGMMQRLGIATALLGDPKVLMFDEPVNGLDPEGIRWVRNLLKQLASEGRTVFVSSHLMSEMEATAEHVIVIGRGRLIADGSIEALTQGSTDSYVRVVTPKANEFAGVLEEEGGRIRREDGALLVRDLGAPAIGELAAARGIALHELSPHRARLEAAFFELTRDSVEYQSREDGASPDDVAVTAAALAQEEETR